MFTNQIKMQLRRASESLLLFAVCLLCHTACTEESFRDDMQQTGRAIRILASLPDDPVLTKVAQPKESFAKDDVIHVYAEFTLSEGTNTTTAYACMKFDGAGNWNASDGTTLEWPWNATKATFKAYYIPPVTVEGTVMKNNTALSKQDGQNTLEFSLSDLTTTAVENGTDPMVATYTDVPVESAVHLQFKHLFAKLTFLHLGKENNYTGNLTDKETLYLSAASLTDSCTFIREADGDKLSDDLSLCKGHVAGRVEPESTDGAYQVTFLIPSLTAAETEFRLLFKDFTSYHLIPLKQPLEAGKHYSLDITKLADNYWSNDLKEEEWNKGETAITFDTDDINAYLSAIRDGEEYRKGVRILDVYMEMENGKSTKVVTQLRDVDFNNQPFTPVHISTNIIFEGNNHRVKNLSIQNSVNETGASGTDYHALFGKNEGTIRNLRIEGAKTTGGATYVGTLVGYNKGTGTIENVRIDFNDNDKVLGADDYTGGLVGMNGGIITGCMLRGKNFHIEVTGGTSDKKYYVGGMAGYNSGESTVKGTRIQAENSSVKFNGSGKIVYIGGWAGHSDNREVLECSTSLSVSLSGTITAGGYAGGFAGEVYNILEKCSATGTAVQSDATAATLVAGGFVAVAKNVDLRACYAANTIGNTTANAQIGGFAGRIVYENTGTSDVLNCFTSGKLSEGVGSGFADFAGISPDNSAGQTTSDKTKVTIRNCFSRNNATTFLGNDAVATLTATHHNGQAAGSQVSVDQLNGEKPADGFSWTDTPALYGEGFPYFIIK